MQVTTLPFYPTAPFQNYSLARKGDVLFLNIKLKHTQAQLLMKQNK